jgi:hypothetical protein
VRRGAGSPSTLRNGRIRNAGRARKEWREANAERLKAYHRRRYAALLPSCQ